MKCYLLFAVSWIAAISGHCDTNFYHSHSSQQTEVALAALEGYQLSGDEHVLDIGSGGGKIAANIAARVPNGSVVGIDIAEEAYSFAVENYNKHLYPNLSFLPGDILEMDFKDEFDVIVSFSSLHWVLDHDFLLEKVKRALKPQGRLLFTIPCKPKPEMSTLFNSILAKEEWEGCMKNYDHPRKKFTTEQYIELLERAGFTSLEVEVIERTHYFVNKREIINWFAAFTPILGYIPNDKHQEFLEDVANSYVLAFPPNENGMIPFVQDELHVRAVRP